MPNNPDEPKPMGFDKLVRDIRIIERDVRVRRYAASETIEAIARLSLMADTMEELFGYVDPDQGCE